LRKGATLGAISDILRVRSNPEVKIVGMAGLDMTLRTVQTPKTFKFGIKNGISGAKKPVLLKMIRLYDIKSDLDYARLVLI